MRGSRDDAVLRWLDISEQVVNTWAFSAKGYWRIWGPLGEPMVHGVDGWAEMQRSYLQWLRQSYEAGNQP